MEHIEPCSILFSYEGSVGELPLGVTTTKAESTALELPKEGKPKWGIANGASGPNERGGGTKSGKRLQH